MSDTPNNQDNSEGQSNQTNESNQSGFYSYRPNNSQNPFGNQNPFSGQNPFKQNQKSPNDFGKNLKKFMGGGFKIVIVLVLLAVLALSSVYTIGSGEEAVITAFGQYKRTETTPGLKIKVPFVEQYYKVNVELVRRMEFGIRDNTAITTESEAESIMLTSDENLVIADWTVLYRITDSYSYLFNVEDAEGTMRIIAESAYRRVVATHPLDDILTNQKDILQNEIAIDLQEICNKYNLGVTINAVQLQDAMPPDEVKAAFLDVSSAMEEKNATINEATKYENEKIPVARGEASQIINDAEGYKQERINNALGDVSRFKAIQAEYANAPEITQSRLFIEMINSVYPKLGNIYITDGDGSTLKFLPIGNNNK